MDDKDQKVLFSILGFSQIMLEDDIPDNHDNMGMSLQTTPNVFFSKVLNNKLPHQDNNTVLMQLLSSKPNTNENFIDTLLSIPGIDLKAKNNKQQNLTDILSDKRQPESKSRRRRKGKKKLADYWKNLSEKVDSYDEDIRKLSKEEQMEQIDVIINGKDDGPLRQDTFGSKSHRLSSSYEHSISKYSHEVVEFLSPKVKTVHNPEHRLERFQSQILLKRFSFHALSLDDDDDDETGDDEVDENLNAAKDNAQANSNDSIDDDDDDDGAEEQLKKHHKRNSTRNIDKMVTIDENKNMDDENKHGGSGKKGKKNKVRDMEKKASTGSDVESDAEPVNIETQVLFDQPEQQTIRIEFINSEESNRIMDRVKIEFDQLKEQLNKQLTTKESKIDGLTQQVDKFKEKLKEIINNSNGKDKEISQFKQEIEQLKQQLKKFVALIFLGFFCFFFHCCLHWCCFNKKKCFQEGETL